MDLGTGLPVGVQASARDSASAPPQTVEVHGGVRTGVKIGFGMFIVLPLLIILGLVVIRALLRPNDKEPVTLGPSRDNSDFEAVAAKHNKGWDWAAQRKATVPSQCEVLEDPLEQEGCASYVGSGATNEPTSPAP